MKAPIAAVGDQQLVAARLPSLTHPLQAAILGSHVVTSWAEAVDCRLHGSTRFPPLQLFAKPLERG